MFCFEPLYRAVLCCAVLCCGDCPCTLHTATVLDATTNPYSKNSAKWLGFGVFNGKAFYLLSILRKKQRDPLEYKEPVVLCQILVL